MSEAQIGYQDQQTEDRQREPVDDETTRERELIIDTTQRDPEELRKVGHRALQWALERRFRELKEGKRGSGKHDSIMF